MIKVNNTPIKSFNFPAGECQVILQNLDIKLYTYINASLHSSDDIMKLLLTVDAVRRIDRETKIKLTIPYFPYARQDRVCSEGEAFSLEVMANLINSLNCFDVLVYDVHSEVATKLINNCSNIELRDCFPEHLEQMVFENNLTLVSPDAGAKQKVEDLAEDISQNIEVICATKVRDPKTGLITETKVDADVEGKDLFVVDDICDGGRTFIELAKVLKSKGANKLYLYVTHGIFSNGKEELSKYYDEIYSFNNFKN
jgi:ribose-phosphate pyrophosphokinase